MGEIFSLPLRRDVLERSDRGRSTGSPLVKHEDPKVLESPFEPARASGLSRRTRCFASRTSLEEHEKGAIAAVRVGYFTGEDGNCVSGRPGMVERYSELVLGRNQSRQQYGGAHVKILPRASIVRLPSRLHGEALMERPWGRRRRPLAAI
jgi:hypothetical protein